MTIRTITLLISTLMTLVSSNIFAQKSSVDREVIVMFQPGIIQLPNGQAEARQ